jgi:hypothetical protein
MANIDSAIGDARRRATSYADIDGLLTLSMSVYALAAGLLATWVHRTNVEWAVFAFFFINLGYWVFIGQPDGPVMLWLKTRITYPRTGFVALPAPANATAAVEKRSTLLKWAAVGALIAAMMYADYAANKWTGLIAMSGGVAAFCLVHRSEAGVRFVWLLLPSLWLSAIIKTLRPTWRIDEVASMFFIFGILLFIAGAVRLLRFLKLHRAPPA